MECSGWNSHDQVVDPSHHQPLVRPHIPPQPCGVDEGPIFLWDPLPHFWSRRSRSAHGGNRRTRPGSYLQII